MKILCLGDSYTIGEKVPYLQNFPNQLVAKFTTQNKVIDELTIIATTGWTTNELIGPMETLVKHANYDLVTLLIGVNNQYRNQNILDYEIHFNYLLNRAIHFANGIASNVIVLSIPDWGLTPFNIERDKEATSKAIDAYNAINIKYAVACNCKYLDITPSTRANASDAQYLADDGLHPSGAEYALWANMIFEAIKS
jgi:lysophospholipase L1-like esterase